MKKMNILPPISNERGVVLITVVVVIIMILMLVVGVTRMSVSQTLLTEDEYKRIQNELLAESTIALIHADQQTAIPKTTDTLTFTLNDITHTVNYTVSGGGIMGSSLVQIDITY